MGAPLKKNKRGGHISGKTKEPGGKRWGWDKGQNKQMIVTTIAKKSDHKKKGRKRLEQTRETTKQKKKKKKKKKRERSDQNTAFTLGPNKVEIRKKETHIEEERSALYCKKFPIIEEEEEGEKKKVRNKTLSRRQCDKEREKWHEEARNEKCPLHLYC